jgi:hypothetical protein
MLKRIVHLLAFLSLMSAAPTLAQQPGQPEAESAEVKELIRRAGVKILEYRNGFKDLTAEEEQTIEEYDGQGKVKKQRRLSSDLFIYQSQLDPTQMVEYRDVKAVDGVAVKKRDTRLVNLLNKSAKADSVQKELDRINRESARYDLSSSSHGMTLNQAILLSENLRPSFCYKLAGREQVNGHDAIVLEYQQVSPNPEIAMKFSSLPSQLKGAETRYRGRLWLDAETAQLRREVRELTIEHPSLRRPLVLMKHEFEYADSRFGFLTPQRTVFSTYTRGRTGADNQRELLLGGKVTLEYGAFTRFSVEAPDATVEPPIKP